MAEIKTCVGCRKQYKEYLGVKNYCSFKCESMAECSTCTICKERPGRVKILCSDLSICTDCFRFNIVPAIRTYHQAEFIEDNIQHLCQNCKVNLKYEGGLGWADKCEKCLESEEDD